MTVIALATVIKRSGCAVATNSWNA
uniref:Uncharacterized protein n=1 Tax=Anguilla anguilla TaxID=7936 RepID=A0A0E9TZH0_ANGAN